LSTRIPKDHLVALIKALRLDDGRRNELLSALNVADQGRWGEVLDAINEAMPGKAAALREMYPEAAVRSVHFFRVEKVDGATAASLQRTIRSRFDVSAHLGTWTDLPQRGRAHTSRILRVKITRDEFVARIRLYREVSVPCDDEEQRVPSSDDFEMRVSLTAPGGRIAEVYASTNHSRLAMLVAMEDLTGLEVPKRKSPGQARFFKPLRFVESNIKQLAEDLDWEVVGYRWDDPTPKAGEWTVVGPQQGTRLMPIDGSHEALKDRERNPNNGRAYTYEFDHGDGYLEPVQLQFFFDGNHPHVQLLRRVSMPARQHVLNLLRDRLKE